jgi:hypothetical protein
MRKGNQIVVENEMRYNDDSGGIIEVVGICSHEGKGSGSCESPFKVRVNMQPRKSAGYRGQNIILSESFTKTTI